MPLRIIAALALIASLQARPAPREPGVCRRCGGFGSGKPDAPCRTCGSVFGE
jgi:hypothetical protein